MLGRVIALAKVWVVAFVLGVVCGTLWWVFGPKKAGGEKIDSPPAAAAVVGSGVEPVGGERWSSDSSQCRCGVDPWCLGPAGGIYCMTDDGVKRYRKKNKSD